MSESDDTDVLLLIPPDLFLVPSSESDDSDFHERRAGYGSKGPGVVSELIGHVQSLETRISAIESRDTSLDVSLLNNSLESQTRSSYRNSFKYKQSQPRIKFSVSQTSSLQNTPVKPRRSSSVPSTPSSYQPSNRTNPTRNDTKLIQHVHISGDTNTINANTHSWNKHGNLTSNSEPTVLCYASRNVEFLHDIVASPKEETQSGIRLDHDASKSTLNFKSTEQLHPMSSVLSLPHKSTGRYHSEPKPVREMDLSEVDELLHDMEVTEMKLAKRIGSVESYPYRQNETHQQDLAQGRSTFSLLTHDKNGDKFPDVSLPYDDSLQLDETDKMISEFKTWQQNTYQSLSDHGERASGSANIKKSVEELTGQPTAQSSASWSKNVAAERRHSNVNLEANAVSTENMHVQSRPGPSNVSIPSPSVNELIKSQASVHSKQIEVTTEPYLQTCKNSHSTGNLQSTIGEMHTIPSYRNTSHAATNTDPCLRKSQRLFTLSDFWENNGSKSQEEMLRIKLEEEKCRREHCENLIQELQKKLLEQQEKVAVAIRVDNEKNVVLSQFQSAWTKLKLRWQVLEVEHRDLQTTLKNVTGKHQSEVAEFQAQIKRCEGELSKALDLAAGYKEKSDSMVKEKLDLLKNHADELENYKSLVQEAQNRYEHMKGECSKVLERNQQMEDALKNVQQELNRERLRGSEVRGEMAVIHKALDACEAELVVLRQEKENLQLKLKEEMNRNNILEQNKTSLLSAFDDVKKAEKLAKDEAMSLLEQQEKIRTDLREVYQKQVDEVVKAKLQEFQTQLDTAESAFQAELETRQRAIAECAARKIKSVIDKHQLEINLLEEKHKEEKRLCEIQLAQAVQHSSMLEAQLNTQRATKTHLAEQLHSVMQKQWQQALHIISGGNSENLTPIQRINAEKLFDAKNTKRCESMVNCCGNKVYAEPMRLESQSMPTLDMRNFPTAQSAEDHNDSLITMASTEETPLTSRKEAKDDLRRYIKMILDMQQPKDAFSKARFTEYNSSPTPICREVPRKHYTKREQSVMSEESIAWQPTPEVPISDETEYVSIPQKLAVKGEQQKNKPPWK